MSFHPSLLTLRTSGKGLYDLTEQVQQSVAQSGVESGMCFLFIQHTSASLVISENYDPSAKGDLQRFMDRLVPEDQPWMQHEDEGPDDSPSHMRAMLTRSSEAIPIVKGRLALGSWQGIFVFEHRTAPHSRRVVVQIQG